MKLIHRKINIETDKDYILECHCINNYECDTPWQRDKTYQQYRNEWFGLKSQIDEFLNALSESQKDERTIAEIIETQTGKIVAYLWATFFEDKESGFKFADIQDIYVETDFRNQGIATILMKYAEDKARQNGAKVIRSGTGSQNFKSKSLHEKNGYYQYRYEFEKLL